MDTYTEGWLALPLTVGRVRGGTCATPLPWRDLSGGGSRSASLGRAATWFCRAGDFAARADHARQRPGPVRKHPEWGRRALRSADRQSAMLLTLLRQRRAGAGPDRAGLHHHSPKEMRARYCISTAAGICRGPLRRLFLGETVPDARRILFMADSRAVMIPPVPGNRTRRILRAGLRAETRQRGSSGCGPRTTMLCKPVTRLVHVAVEPPPLRPRLRRRWAWHCCSRGRR